MELEEAGTEYLAWHHLIMNFSVPSKHKSCLNLGSSAVGRALDFKEKGLDQIVQVFSSSPLMKTLLRCCPPQSHFLFTQGLLAYLVYEENKIVWSGSSEVQNLI